MAQAQPAWLQHGLTYLGLKEVPGKQNNASIVGWWKRIRAPFKDDETPWCAGFVGGVLEECNIVSSRSAAAKSYQNWGQPVGPCVGAVVVFWRGTPEAATGHVGFIVGKDQLGNLMVLGGNQGDCVSIKPFALERVLSYHWPKLVAAPIEQSMKTLPLVKSDGQLSTTEA